MAEIKLLKLYGCTPEPLAANFKALGVLRLIVESGCDSKAKGYWDAINDVFVIQTERTQEEILQYFLYEYEPTPLVAPWNGSTGFYPKDNKNTINAVRNANAKRLKSYILTITKAQNAVDALKLTAQPKNREEKRRLLQKLRNTLPDAAVKWIDTCALITSEDLKFPPLTGTGGNDGNFEFSRTFQQQLQEIIDFETGQPTSKAPSLLKAALFDETLPALSFSGKIGQFNPIAAGGANAAPGYDADSRVNPWDFILMLEGIMMFAASATRRYESSGTGDFAYPFTVRADNVGYASASAKDEARAEIWVPLWGQPASLKELQIFFNEGRIKVGRRTARDGIDIARALSSRAQARNVDAFVRYSFQVRNGLSYFAIPLGKFKPKYNPSVERLAELDPWLMRFDANVTEAPTSVKKAHRYLKAVLFNFYAGKNNTKLLDVLSCLAEVEAALDNSLKAIKDLIPPIPILKKEWATDCNDNSVEFRLALSLASKELRQRLVRVKQNELFTFWVEGTDNHVTTWKKSNLVNNLIAWLKREEIENMKDEVETKDKIKMFVNASFNDIIYWIDGEIDEIKLEKIARGLSLVNIEKKMNDDIYQFIPPNYALLKIVYDRTISQKETRNVFKKYVISKDMKIPPVPALLNKLEAGNIQYATQLAIRRLRASRLQPVYGNEGIEPYGIDARRLAAALAFPISSKQTAQLLYEVSKLRFSTY